MQKGMVRSNGKKFPFQIPEEQGIFPCNALLFKTYGYQLIQYDKAKFAGYSIDATCKICFGILYGCPNNFVWNFFTVTVRGKTMKANYFWWIVQLQYALEYEKWKDYLANFVLTHFGPRDVMDFTRYIEWLIAS